MAETRPAEPAKLIIGAITGFPEAWELARAELVGRFGPIDHAAGPLAFEFTDYYAEEMGDGLQRWLVSFERLVGQHEIAAVKHATNRMEAEVAAPGRWPVPRPVNLDPGYVTLGKLVLATAKDQAHRIAVGGDIYAEVTLRFREGRFEGWEWTYPDYRQESYLRFFGEVRERLRAQLR